MNKKGFTLIELIVTIALLAIISLISFVSINKAIQKSKDNECENIRKSIQSAAVVYFSNHRYDQDVTDSVKVSTLVDEGYLTSSTIKNPYESGNLDINTTVSVDKNGNVQGLPYNCKKQ